MAEVGSVVGVIVGERVGENVGKLVGNLDGLLEGIRVGFVEGKRVKVGSAEGLTVDLMMEPRDLVGVREGILE